MGSYGEFMSYVGGLGATFGSLCGLISNPEPPDDTSLIKLAPYNGAESSFPTLTLPGIVQAEEVQQQMEIERVPLQGRSGTGKILDGWSDAIVRFTLRLTNDPSPESFMEKLGAVLSLDFAAALETMAADPETPATAVDKLAALNLFAKYYDPNRTPQVWEITQEIANAHGVKQVIFSRFDSMRTARLDVIDVDLEFLEWVPATVLIETGEALPEAPAEIPAPDTTNPLE